MSDHHIACALKFLPHGFCDCSQVQSFQSGLTDLASCHAAAAPFPSRKSVPPEGLPQFSACGVIVPRGGPHAWSNNNERTKP